MKSLYAAALTAAALATTASAGPVQWGFKSVDGVEDGATEITWDGGGVYLSQTNDLLTVEVKGAEHLPRVDDPNVSGLEAWVADWSMPMGEWNTFDLYLFKWNNTHCDILVTPFGVDFFNGGVSDLVWNNPTGLGNGQCSTTTDDVVYTANIATAPLPANALLLLSGLAGFGALRRKLKA